MFYTLTISRSYQFQQRNSVIKVYTQIKTSEAFEMQICQYVEAFGLPPALDPPPICSILRH